MKVFLTVLSVVIILVIAYVTLIFANRGEDKYTSEYLAEAASPSESVNVSPSAEPSETPIVTPSPSETPSPTPQIGPVNPLTGLPMDEISLNNRPIAIMINNLSTAQPQLGISKADLIYEILVEGGITRMMAVFQDVSNTGVIGSIRSARPYFVDIANGYNAVYIHAGGSPDGYVELKATNITHLDGVNGRKQDIFYRDKARQKKMGYEHSLVTTSDLIDKFLPVYDIPLTQADSFKYTMKFAEDAVPDGDKAAATVTVHFSSSKKTLFTYSESDGLYTITQYGKAYTDGNDNLKVGVTNVLILRTRINVISGDKEGRIDVDTVGSGSGIFFNSGKYEDIKWSRKDNSSQFTFTLTDGTPLEFGCGKTYICVVGMKDPVEYK